MSAYIRQVVILQKSFIMLPMIILTSGSVITGTANIPQVLKFFWSPAFIPLVYFPLLQDCLKHIIWNRQRTVTGGGFHSDLLFCIGFWSKIFFFRVHLNTQLSLQFQRSIDKIYVGIFPPVNFTTPQSHQHIKGKCSISECLAKKKRAMDNPPPLIIIVYILPVLPVTMASDHPGLPDNSASQNPACTLEGIPDMCIH